MSNGSPVPPPSVVLPGVLEESTQEVPHEETSQTSTTPPERAPQVVKTSVGESESKDSANQVIKEKPPVEKPQQETTVSFNAEAGGAITPAPQIDIGGVSQGPADPNAAPSNLKETGFDDNTIKSSDLDFFSAELRTYRIGIIHIPDMRPCIVVPVHYKENYFICHTTDESNPKECCEVLGPARPRIGSIIIVYGTDKNGQLREPFTFELKAWLYGADKYEMMKISNQTFPLNSNDLMVTCTEKTYQRMNIQPAKGSVWQSGGDDFKKWIITEAKKMMKRIPQVIARKLNRAEMLDRVGLNVGPPETSHPPVDFNQAVMGNSS